MTNHNVNSEDNSTNHVIEVSLRTWIIAALITVIVVVIDVVCMQNQLSVVYPNGDDFSMVAISQDSPLEWLTKGFSEAFNAYPEYFRPYSNFIRPTANLLFKAFSFVPNSHQSQLVAVNFLVHALICAFIYIFSTIFRNSQRFSVCLASIAFFAPAFWNTPMVISPSFAMDGVAAFNCLLSVVLIVRGRMLLGCVFLMIAILTKETALPIAGALLLSGLIIRQPKLVFGSCFILIVWLSLRYFAFGAMIGGTYSTNGMSLELLARKIFVLALLPVSYFDMGDVKNLILYKDNLVTFLFLIGNLAIGLSTLLLIIRGRYIHDLINPSYEKVVTLDIRKLSFMTLACMGASIAFLSVVGGQVRFGYVSFVFWLMFIGTIQNQRRLKTGVLFLLFSLLVIGFYIRLPQVINVDEMHVYKYEGANKHIEYLKNTEIADGTYVFNDYFALYSKQENVAKYAGLNIKMFRGSTIDKKDCSVEDIESIDTKFEEKVSGVKLLVTKIPACAEFTFPSANQDVLTQNVHGKILRRNDSITYKFDGINVSLSDLSQVQNIVSFGQTMEVTVVDSPVLYFDFIENEWIYLP